MVHQVVKAEKIAAVAAVALEQQLVVPNVFRREGFDAFKGAKDDTINVVVEGVLPYRSYGWRADRSAEVVFDEYTERKVAVTFGGDIYSAVKLTDEQNEMDLPGWTKLASKQVEAIGRGLEFQATDYLRNDAPYEVEVTLDEANLKGSLINLRGVMNKLRVAGPRTLLVGTDIENALLNDEKIFGANASDAGDIQSALKEATLGRRWGFDFVVADELGADEGVAMVDSGFVFVTGAPTVPQSVPFGATASYDGVAIRWIRDYDSTRFQDRSIFNTYKSFRYVDDPLVGTDSEGQSFISTANHFVRAVKVTMGAAYNVEIGNAELANITGLASTDGLNDGA